MTNDSWQWCRRVCRCCLKDHWKQWNTSVALNIWSEEWSGRGEGNQVTVHGKWHVFVFVHSMASWCKLFLRKQFVPQIRGCNYAEAVLRRFDVASIAGVEKDPKKSCSLPCLFLVVVTCFMHIRVAWLLTYDMWPYLCHRVRDDLLHLSVVKGHGWTCFCSSDDQYKRLRT